MAVKHTSILFLFYSIAADIIILNRVRIKTAYVVSEQRRRSAYASIQSEQRLFISCFDIIKYMVAISQITILSKQASLSLDQSHNS